MNELPPPRITDEQVAALPLGRARAELMEEIMATPTSAPHRPEVPPDRRRSRRWTVVAGAAAAIAVIAATPVWLASRDDGPATSPTRAVEPTPAGPSPYAVLDAPGWSVDHVDGDPTDGEIRYAKGDQELQVNWRPGDSYDGYDKDRKDTGPSSPVTLLGQPSKEWAYDREDHTTMRPVQGDTFLEVRGSGMDRAAYEALLGELRQVDAAGFESALPASVVRPDQVASTVASMLSDIETPAGFDPTAIEVPAYQGRYDVGAAVTSAVGCAWIDQYGTARRTGDDASEQEATDAMQGSRRWAVLDEMTADGDWSPVFWQLGRDMAAGRPAGSLRGAVGC